jgi:hypothetical protein
MQFTKLLHIQQFLQPELVARTQDKHVSSSSCEFKDSFRPRTLDACTQDLTLTSGQRKRNNLHCRDTVSED